MRIPHSLRYESKYGFEDILTVLEIFYFIFFIFKRKLQIFSPQHLTNPSHYTNHRFQPFPPHLIFYSGSKTMKLMDIFTYVSLILRRIALNQKI